MKKKWEKTQQNTKKITKGKNENEKNEKGGK